MVVEKLKEREDARDNKQDIENLYVEIESLTSQRNELLNENAHLLLSLKNAGNEYAKAAEMIIQYENRIKKYEESIDNFKKEINLLIDKLKY